MRRRDGVSKTRRAFLYPHIAHPMDGFYGFGVFGVFFDFRDGAKLLFNVVAQAYEHQSVIVTSNLEFGQWNSVLGDNRLTAAMIDRLVHHAHILAFEGESYRLKKALSGLAQNRNEHEAVLQN